MEWDEDEEDEDVDFIDLDQSGDEGSNSSKDSDKVYWEEAIDNHHDNNEKGE